MTIGTNAVIKIELSGANALLGGGMDGLDIGGGGTTVRGLAISGFKNNAVFTGGTGIKLLNIAGNTGNKIEGNFIGTDASGTVDVGNELSGVSAIANSTNNTIGGGSLANRNLISGNGLNGVDLNSIGNFVQNNLIGTDRSGKQDLGNSASGVIIFNNPANAIVNNTIAFNRSNGVRVDCDPATRNAILSNSIFSNGGLGIDLGNDGPTANDPGDADTGPNNLQNTPAITSAKTSATSTTLKVTLNSSPNTSNIFQFYANPKGTSQGKTLVGETNFSTDNNGNASFTFTTPKKVPVGRTLTAIANGPGGDTSEFSSPRTVKDAVHPKVKSVAPTPDAPGVATGANVLATFSETMKATTINTTTVKLRKAGTTTNVAARVAYDPARKRAKLDPRSGLQAGATYIATVNTGAKDLAGNALDQNPDTAGNQAKTWKFTVRK
jgi:hypothetical protein